MSSDDFDKEAEREKLREKYEQDKKDRESTQRMSELLLQGATMTGKHCGECGDPIFRYDGQEFCPTCQREVAGEDATEGSDSAEATDHTDRTDGENHESPGEASESDGEPRVEINDVRVADRHADRTDLRDPPSQRRGTGQGRTGGEDAAHGHHGRRDSSESPNSVASRREARRGRDSTSASDASHQTHSNDLATARASLVRTLSDLTRRAEETDDVARTRELLAATREAAEAIAALDGTTR